MKLKKTTLIYIRHGQTTANITQCWSGISNVDLTPKGIKDSEHICEKISNYKVDFIYSSPLHRAKYMAKVIGKKSKINVIVDERIIERNFGSLEKKEIRSNEKEAIGNWQKNSDLSVGVEKVQDMFHKRVKPFLDEIIAEHKNKTIVIVSHSWVGRLMNYYFSDNKDFEIIKIAPKNATPIVFEI